ncbi:MAG: phage portal protein [Tyzzerella sp.]|nr:phage portal protein [Tyzzerella sp.]
MENCKGIAYLRNKLANKKLRVETRYKFYEMKNIARDLQLAAPPEFNWLSATLGWCGKAVDSLADRIIFYSWDNDNFDLQEIFQLNNPDTFFDSAVLSALISSCCFVYISADETGYPRLQVIDGGNATGIIDPITGLLKEGYAVLERDDNNKPTLEAWFTARRTEFIRKGKSKTQVITNKVPYPLLVPIIYRPDAKRPFGHSRISRACMKIQESALRTIKRSEISAEFYSFPQKYILGMSSDAEQMDKWKVTMSSLLRIDKDEDGDKPTVGQFQQQSMSPYTEQLRTFAALFAGETGLTLDDLGFVSDNPSSSEAIKASHENLRLMARKAQRNFGSGFLNVGYLAACLRDDYAYQRQQLYLTKPLWEPIFEPDAATLSSIGDGAIKINQAVPGYFNKDNFRILTGIEPSKIDAPVTITGQEPTE